MHVCMHARLGGGGGGGGWGHAPPGNFFKIGCSEIASEAILGQKQSRSSCVARGVLHPIFGCPCMHLLSQLTWNFYERRYYGW